MKTLDPKSSSSQSFLSPASNRIPFVSVIVPVYNDAQRIGQCIKALLGQTYPHTHFDVLIVDNGSTDDTPAVIKQYPVKMLIEDAIQSSYAARNKGIRNAKGTVIAFTDADCIPAPDWIEKGVENLMRVPNCGLVAGRINQLFKDPKRPNAVEIYESIMHFRQKRYVQRDRYGATATVFTYKKVFEKVGLFNVTLKSGGDNEWGRRVFSFGYKQIYADDACVDHPTRYSLKQLRDRIIRLTGGGYDKNRQKSFFILVALVKSIKKILSLFIRTVFGLPPVTNLKGIKRKCQFLLICIYVEFVRNCERIRLSAGGISERS